MKTEYIFTGREGQVHKLVQTQKSGVYQVVTDYPIGTTGRPNEFLEIDFSGGPTLIVGDLIESGVQIESINHCNDIGIFITLKEI
jgi:hypothetical protein